MDLHRGFGNHSQSSLTADAEMIDIDAVRGLWNNSRRQYPCRRDHPQRHYHIFNLAVLIDLRSLTADAEMIDIDAVRGLWNNSRRQYPCRRDHPQRNYHIFNLAVLIALHPCGTGGYPNAEGRV